MADPSTDDRKLEARMSVGKSLVLRPSKRRRGIAKVMMDTDQASVRTHIASKEYCSKRTARGLLGLLNEDGCFFII